MDNIHSSWDDTEAVVMALELSDPNQPYSCSSWGNQFDDSEPLIVNGGSPYFHWWGMFESTYVPANAFNGPVDPEGVPEASCVQSNISDVELLNGP